jgi:hypothetical protein
VTLDANSGIYKVFLVRSEVNMLLYCFCAKSTYARELRVLDLGVVRSNERFKIDNSVVRVGLL